MTQDELEGARREYQRVLVWWRGHHMSEADVRALQQGSISDQRIAELARAYAMSA